MFPRGRRLLAFLLILPVYTAVVMFALLTTYYVLMDPRYGTLYVGELLTNFTLAEWMEGFLDPVTWVFVVVPALALVISQVAFLMPWVHRPLALRTERRSLLASMASAAFVAAMLTAALFFAIAAVVKLARGASVEFKSGFYAHVVILLGVFCLCWVFWTAAFWVFTSRIEPRHRVKRWTGLLLGGTIAELVLLLPLDIMTRRKTDCYCSTPAYWSICMSLWALLWLTGPGVVLLLTRKHRHRLWSGNHCLRCGYERGPTPGEKCPECGYAWKA